MTPLAVQKVLYVTTCHDGGLVFNSSTTEINGSDACYGRVPPERKM